MVQEGAGAGLGTVDTVWHARMPLACMAAKRRKTIASRVAGILPAKSEVMGRRRSHAASAFLFYAVLRR